MEVAARVLSHTMNLSIQLQDPACDLSEALENVSTVISTLQQMKDEADQEFQAIFQDAQEMAAAVGQTIEKPRTCGRQAHRNNTAADSAHEYFLKALFVPFLEHLIADLQLRFQDVLKEVVGLQGLIPSRLSAYTDEQILKAAKTYEDDLLTVAEAELRAELVLWRSQWQGEEVCLSITLKKSLLC